MMYLVWELNPWLSVHEADTLPSELTRFYICQAGFEPTTFILSVLPIAQLVERQPHELKAVGSILAYPYF